MIPRSSIAFFTTNYDTLLEDALILEKQKICDGFIGTAMGFWNPEISFKDRDSIPVYKGEKLESKYSFAISKPSTDCENPRSAPRPGWRILTRNKPVMIAKVLVNK